MKLTDLSRFARQSLYLLRTHEIKERKNFILELTFFFKKKIKCVYMFLFLWTISYGLFKQINLIIDDQSISWQSHFFDNFCYF